MTESELFGFGFLIILAATIAGIGVMINRRTAKTGSIAILVIIPFLFLFGIPFLRGEIPREFEPFSNSLIVGILSSVIGGLILIGLIKK